MRYKVKLDKQGLLIFARITNTKTGKLLNVIEDLDTNYVKDSVMEYMDKLGYKYLVDYDFERVVR